MKPRRALLAYLNTGGGHRSAALAVAEELEELYGEAVLPDLVDVTTDWFPWPLSKLDTAYRGLVALNGWPWLFTYRLTNTPGRMRVLNRAWWGLTKRSTLRLLRDSPTDLIVCCHPLLKAPLARALQALKLHVPLFTLVTDLKYGHAAWFRPPDGPYLVATEQMSRQAVACGCMSELVQVTGLPVRPRFRRAAGEDQCEARSRLGLDPSRPVILLVAGADGMGPFQRLVRAVLAGESDAQLVVISGRNERMRARLKAARWCGPVCVLGYVENIHEWMRAADLLVTKAGPASIAEAMVVGVPMVLCRAVPGQEPPNVAYVVKSGAGIWAPTPEGAAAEVHRLLGRDRRELERMREQARRASRPDAARQVAEIVWQAVHAAEKVDRDGTD